MGNRFVVVPTFSCIVTYFQQKMTMPLLTTTQLRRIIFVNKQLLCIKKKYKEIISLFYRLKNYNSINC